MLPAKEVEKLLVAPNPEDAANVQVPVPGATDPSAGKQGPLCNLQPGKRTDQSGYALVILALLNDSSSVQYGDIRKAIIRRTRLVRDAMLFTDVQHSVIQN